MVAFLTAGWLKIFLGLAVTALLSGGLIFYGYTWGRDTASEQAALIAQKNLAASVKEGIERSGIGVKVETIYVDRVKVVTVRGDTIIKEVTNVVQDNGCRYHPSIGVLLNAAALNDPLSLPPGVTVGSPAYSRADPAPASGGLRPARSGL